MEAIAGITKEKTNTGNIIVSDKNKTQAISLYKDQSIIMNEIDFVRYIKSIESLVRTDKQYRSYIRYLKTELDPPLNHCMIYSNVTDDSAKVEMHHGPIFTLYDYVEIVIIHLFKNKKLFSSPRVANIVLKEHRLNNVQVVMLSEAAHLAMHPKKKEIKPKFLDYKFAHGNIVEFLKKYYDGLSFSHIGKIKRYFDSYYKKKDDESKFFDEFVTKWTKEIIGN